MNPLGFEPLMDFEYKQRHEELIKKAAQFHMVKEILRAEAPKTSSTSSIMALIGKALANLGSRLEKRYGSYPETRPSFVSRTNPSEC
jgi:hypothetical protein